MCTVTWTHKPDGYVLHFNRDELRTRKAALPPAMFTQHSSHYIAPIDADAGGTWLAVNEYGVTCFLLNFYLAEARYNPVPMAKSRGGIIPSIISESTADDAMKKAEQLDLSPFLAFTLGAIDPYSGDSRLLIWDGSVTIEHNTVPPLSSSSYRSREVIQSRLQVYEKSNLRGELYHRSHTPEKGPFSVCMHRPDARTVSYSKITVSPLNVIFDYAPGSPCETELGSTPVQLPRIGPTSKF